MSFFLKAGIAATLLIVSVSGVHADQNAAGIFPKGAAFDGKTMIVTGRPAGEEGTAWGITGPVFGVVVIPAGGGQPETHQMILDTGELPNPGDRYTLSNETGCSETHVRVDLTTL